MKIGGFFRWLLSVITTPFFVILYLNYEKAAEEQGLDTLLSSFLSNHAPGLLELLIAPAIQFVAVAVIAFAAGVWADTLIRRLDAKQPSRQERAVKLGQALRAIRNRLTTIADLKDRWGLDKRQMTLAYADFAALQVSLNKVGIKTPWTVWDGPDEDATHYLNVNLGYMAIMVPLLMRGHLKEAKLAAEKLTDQAKDEDQRYRQFLSSNVERGA